MDRTIEFSQVVDRCCGLDVHKRVIVATVDGTGIERETREFESTTRSLTELKEWLLDLGVTHVAMESTGVYWKPVINILEPGGFTLLVVNARHIRYVLGIRLTRRIRHGYVSCYVRSSQGSFIRTGLNVICVTWRVIAVRRCKRWQPRRTGYWRCLRMPTWNFQVFSVMWTGLPVQGW